MSIEWSFAHCGGIWSDITTPNRTLRLAAPKVLWKNRAWMSRCQLRDSEAEDRWLLSRFAYSIPRPEDAPEDWTHQTKTLYADGYGTTRWGPHGGSGRAASTCDGYQIKGVGVTSLVGKHTDWHHGHGNAWLEECIREIVYSEVVQRSFPYSASPVIALIDTGLNDRSSEACQGERRALLIRPLEVRPAHFQRAPGFEPLVPWASNAQLYDVRRTRLFVEAFMRSADSSAVITALSETFHRLGAQAGAAQYLRLHTGGMYSSNVAMNGRLLDFGSMSAMDFRHGGNSVVGAPTLGTELETLAEVAESVTFFIWKYAREVFRSDLKERLTADATRACKAEHLRQATDLLVSSGEQESSATWKAQLLSSATLTGCSTSPGRRSGRPPLATNGAFDGHALWLQIENQASHLCAPLERSRLQHTIRQRLDNFALQAIDADSVASLVDSLINSHFLAMQRRDQVLRHALNEFVNTRQGQPWDNDKQRRPDAEA